MSRKRPDRDKEYLADLMEPNRTYGGSCAPFLFAKAMQVLNRLDRKIDQRIQSQFDELAVNPLDPHKANRGRF